ncbi:MAG: zinc-binding dehydrogenase [Spirochaetes bacterium]|nr:zinc-binding dehydrogenase [Spirochaetota bacterium]
MKGRRVVFRSVAVAALEPFEVAPPKPGEVLIENDYSVVSAGTERANLLNMQNTGPSSAVDFATVQAPPPEGKFPFYPGYCAVGRIAALGAGVEKLRVGQRALNPWTGHASHGIQRAEGLVLVEDERIDSLEASIANIASFGIHGVRKLRLELGEPAMVIGLGLLGMFAVQAAAQSGAVPVIVTDFDPERRALAKRLGADVAFSPDEDRLPQKIRDLTGGRGAAGIVEVTGSAKALQQALTYVAREGRVSLLGCTRVSDAPIDFYQYVHQRGVSLIGAHTGVRPRQDSRPGYWTEQDDFRAFLALLAVGRMKVRPLLTEIVSPEQAPDVYARLAEGKNPPLGTVFDWRQVQ